MKTSPARVGDYFELFCELELLMAVSTCPGGDLSVLIWGPGSGGEPACHPVLVEVFGVDVQLLERWTPPPRAAYAGRHGLQFPEGVPPALSEAVPAHSYPCCAAVTPASWGCRCTRRRNC